MRFRVEAQGFEAHVAQLMAAIAAGEDMPPLIANYAAGGYVLNDGNHRFEAYNRLGIEEYYVIVRITEKQEYELFMEKYSQYLK